MNNLISNISRWTQIKYDNFVYQKKTYPDKLSSSVWSAYKKLHSFKLEPQLVDQLYENRVHMKDYCQKKHHQYSDVKIGVIGIGNAGCNVLTTYLRNYEPFNRNIRFIAINTERDALRKISRQCKILQLGKLGRGSGSDRNVARDLAQEHQNEIIQLLKRLDLVILIAGIGKGTGSGATPVIASLAKELNIKVLSLVFYPNTDHAGIDQKLEYKDALNNLKLNSHSILVLKNKTFYQPNNTENQAFIASNNHLINNLQIMLDLAGYLYANTDSSDFLKIINDGYAFAIHHVDNKIKLFFDNFAVEMREVLTNYDIDNNESIKSVLLAIKNGNKSVTNAENDNLIKICRNIFEKQKSLHFSSTYYKGYSSMSQIVILVAAKMAHNKNIELSKIAANEEPLAFDVNHVLNANKEIVYSTDQVITNDHVDNEEPMRLQEQQKKNLRAKINLDNGYVSNDELLESFTRLYTLNKTSYVGLEGENK